LTLRVSPSIVVLEPESDFKGNLVIARVIGAKPVALDYGRTGVLSHGSAPRHSLNSASAIH